MDSRYIFSGLIGVAMLYFPWAVHGADVTRSSPSAQTRGTIQPAPGAITVKPDLSIVSLSWSSPPKAGQRIGYTSILNVQARNGGKVVSPQTQIRYTCRRVTPSGACPAVLSGNRTLPTIAPGGAIGLPWPDASTEQWSPGSYRIDVQLDPRNTVAESSESNNSRSVNFNVAATVLPTAPGKVMPPAAKGMGSPLGPRAINPQPEPPGKSAGPVMKPAEKIGINPQPEPPGKRVAPVVKPAEKTGINPQPEPPGKNNKPVLKPAEKIGINPQPEPPGSKPLLADAASRVTSQTQQAPFKPKVVTTSQLTLTGVTPAPFSPKQATAAELTITGRAAVSFKPKMVTVAELTITGNTPIPFAPKIVTVPELTVTGRIRR